MTRTGQARAWQRPGWWRCTAAVIILVTDLTTAGMMTAAGEYGPAAALAVFALAASRWFRRWPWTARWLFRREITRTRHVGGETRFAYPFTAPLQRRRRIPREPRMRQKSRGDLNG